MENQIEEGVVLEKYCIKCGCTEQWACEGSCSWVNDEENICSECANLHAGSVPEGILARIINIDSGLAAQMLQQNQGNRTISQTTVEFYARQMLDGFWQFDAAPIRFGISGRLLDGQHRLLAIVKSNTVQPFLVVTGVPENSFKVMDTGKSRTARDVLTIAGVKNPILISSVAKLLYSLQNGYYESGSGSEKYKFSNSSIERLVAEQPDLLGQCEKGLSYFAKFKYLPPKLTVGLYVIFSRRDQLEANLFFSGLSSGANLMETSPVFHLRNQLIANFSSKYKMWESEKVRLIIKAWNLFREGKQVKVLKLEQKEKVGKPI